MAKFHYNKVALLKMFSTIHVETLGGVVIVFHFTQNEEFITLADPSLSLLTGEEEGEMDSLEDLPQHKVTDYRSVNTRTLHMFGQL